MGKNSGGLNAMTDYSKFDKTIKVGDIVTSCYDGYWEVTHIEIRKPYTNGCLRDIAPSPLFSGKYIMKSDGTPIKKGRTDSWDASYSRKITEEFIREQYNHELTLSDIKKDNLFKLIKTK
jgi:hypothetical protein